MVPRARASSRRSSCRSCRATCACSSPTAARSARARASAAPGEWRTNVSLGGRLEPVDPPEEALRLAVAAIAAIGIDFAGVDLLPDRGRRLDRARGERRRRLRRALLASGPRRLRRRRRRARARRASRPRHEPASRPEGLRLPDRALARLRPRLPGRARDLAATRRRRRSGTQRASSGSSGGSDLLRARRSSATCSSAGGTLLHAADWTYWLSEFGVLSLTLLWVYLYRYEGFIRFRNWILLTNVLGLVVYAWLPTAPPRLLPWEGFVDTLGAERGPEPRHRPRAARREPVRGDAEPALGGRAHRRRHARLGGDLALGPPLAPVARLGLVRAGGDREPLLDATSPRGSCSPGSRP